MFDLKGFRKDRKLSQKQISEILGIGASFVSQIETGKDPMPGYIPEKLAATFGQEEVDKYDREIPFSVSAGLFRRKYIVPAFHTRTSDGAAEGKNNRAEREPVDPTLVKRVLEAIERRDELAMQQQLEYERQGARIDELLAAIR